MWDLETEGEPHTFAGHSDSVRGVVVCPNRWCAVSASYDKTLKVWGLEVGHELGTQGSSLDWRY